MNNRRFPPIGALLSGVLFAAAANFMFIVSDTLIKLLAADYSIFLIMAVEASAGLALVVIILLRSGEPFPPRIRNPLGVLLRSILAATGALASYYAFSRLPLANVYSMIFCAPLIVTAAAAPLLGERVNARRWLATVVGFAGVLVILRPGLAPLSLGHAAALLAAFISAAVVLLMRAIAAHELRSVFVGAIMLAHLVAGLPGAIMTWQPMPWTHLGLAAVAGFAIVAAQYLILEAVRLAPAVSVAPMQYTRLVWAVIVGMVVFGDWPSLNLIVGSAIIILASLYIMDSDRRAKRTAAELQKSPEKSGRG